MTPITVLSLFDGISCGRVALQRANIPVAKYYASEIDKYAIQVTQKNFPDTIQIGDVTKIEFSKYAGEIDLLIGGSPCQDLSIAGKREGLSGERSGLFFKYVEALNKIKPKWFLLENNVGMPQKAYEKISELMGCYPVEINSALLSAQNRRRYYWTNIGPKEISLFGFATCTIPQPQDKGIILQDILETGNAYEHKSYCLTSSNGGLVFEHDYPKKNKNGVADPIRVPENTVKGYAEIEQFECVDLTHINSKTRRGRAMKEKSNCLQTSPQFYQYLGPVQIGHLGKTNSQSGRIYSVKNKSVALNANGGGGGAKTGLYKIDLPDGEYIIRKLTPVECERLQTLPDNYTAGISDTQRYKCIGNGWTVDVIAHIFSFIPKEDK